jgi:hypothetical protein
MVSKKLWVLVISSLFTSFVMHGAAFGAESARVTTLADEDDSLMKMGRRIMQLMNSPYGQRFLHGDEVAALLEQTTPSPVKASDSPATLPQVKKSTVDQATQTLSESEIRGSSSAGDDRDAKRAAAILSQVQKDKDSASVAKRDFDAKKREEARRQQRTRALAAVEHLFLWEQLLQYLVMQGMSQKDLNSKLVRNDILLGFVARWHNQQNLVCESLGVVLGRHQNLEERSLQAMQLEE